MLLPAWGRRAPGRPSTSVGAGAPLQAAAAGGEDPPRPVPCPRPAERLRGGERPALASPGPPAPLTGRAARGRGAQAPRAGCARLPGPEAGGVCRAKPKFTSKATERAASLGDGLPRQLSPSERNAPAAAAGGGRGACGEAQPRPRGHGGCPHRRPLRQVVWEGDPAASPVV